MSFDFRKEKSRNGGSSLVFWSSRQRRCYTFWSGSQWDFRFQTVLWSKRGGFVEGVLLEGTERGEVDTFQLGVDFQRVLPLFVSFCSGRESVVNHKTTVPKPRGIRGDSL